MKTPTTKEIAAWRNSDTGSQQRETKLVRCAAHFYRAGHLAALAHANAVALILR